jgi:hypothetical protein
MKKFIVCLLLLVPGLPAFSLELVPVGQIDIGAAYNNINSARDSATALGQMLLLPAIKLGERDFILPVFFANIADQGVVIEEESFFARRLLVLAKPSYKHLFSKELEARARGEAKHGFNQESQGETLGQGLYDYEEYSGGAEAAYTTSLLGKTRFSLGADYQHRAYPNYHNPGAVLSTNHAKNYYVKDYNGTKGILEAKTEMGSWGMDLRYSLLLKGYTDNYSPAKDGTVDYNAARLDYYHTLEADLGGQVSDNLKLGLDFTGIMNSSNAVFYDASSSLLSSGGFYDKYLPDFFSYTSASLRPSARWYFSGKPDGHNLGLTYGALFRNYAGRPIRGTTGVYAEGKQADLEHSLSLDFLAALSQHFSLIGGLSHVWATSNQLFESPIMTNYRLLSANLGLRYKF